MSVCLTTSEMNGFIKIHAEYCVAWPNFAIFSLFPSVSCFSLLVGFSFFHSQTNLGINHLCSYITSVSPQLPSALTAPLLNHPAVSRNFSVPHSPARLPFLLLHLCLPRLPSLAVYPPHLSLLFPSFYVDPSQISMCVEAHCHA